MTARTVSELANWDGRLAKQRQNSKWRRSSSSLARDPYHIPLENQPLDVLQPPGNFADQRRAEQSVFRSNPERGSLGNSTSNARLHSRVDTTSTPSYDTHHYHQASVAHTALNPASSSSPFIASSKSHHTPNSSVHASRVHNSQPSSSRERIAPLQPASTIESEVIDLTLEDTEDELSVSVAPNSTKHNDQYVDPGPSRRHLSSASSSPIALEQSLFTPPPPPRKRTRLFIDYLAVPPFPKGLTKADYQPMSSHSVVPLPGATATGNTLRHSSPAEPLVPEERTPPRKRKGKEREHDVVSSCKKYKPHPANGVDVVPDLDAFFGHIMIPLYDDDLYPPLTALDLAINTRVQFTHAWRERASRLREVELGWMYNFKLPEKAYICAQSVDTSAPRIPGTVGYVSNEQLRSWELVSPEGSPQENAQTTESDSTIEVNADHLLLPDDALPGPSATFDPALSDSTVSQGLAAVDAEHDMNQYFNGLSDSPAKHIPPRQQLAPTHTFRPHLLQSGGHAEANSLGLGFPSLELDHRLADTGDYDCFLGVPPSPPPADMESSTSPSLIPEPPFEPVNYFPASPNNIFEASPTDAWSFEQGESLLPDNVSPLNNHVAPSALGTIDPSLLGSGQSQTQSRPPKAKVATPRRRSKLPEPVIYIRRPIDSSSLPLLSGKRPVRIKYRDSGGSPATPSTPTGSNGAPSNPIGNPIEQTENDADDALPTKRPSAPSRKLREYHAASESDSDYIPETSAPKIKIKLKLKRPSLRDEGSVVQDQGKEVETVPTMSFCHQCRNKSARPKMSCSNVVQGRVCGKRFCNRCILYRYPDVTFDEHSAGFLCPVCTNTCNCSCCSRNRGEEFISMRLGGLAASLFKSKVTLVRDEGEPLHRPRNVDAQRSVSATTTPTPEPSALPMQSQFWAHVYGIEGERVGSAFMTREHMERLQAPGPSHPPPPPLSKPQPAKKARRPTKRDKERERTKGPRVFVGRPLAWWKVRAVRDLEQSVDVEINRDKGKGKDQGTGQDNTVSDRRPRFYVGNPAPLYEAYGRMPGTASPTPPPSSRCLTSVLDSDGSLTPLSDLEAAYWPQPEVGECCTWAPPPPPGTNVHGLSSAFAGELPGTGPPGDVDGSQGLRSNSGLEMEMDVDAGNERASTSTALSKEDLERAITAALAALAVGSPF